MEQITQEHKGGVIFEDHGEIIKIEFKEDSNKDVDTAIHKLIQIEVDRLVEKYELDYKRTYTLLGKTIRYYYFEPLPSKKLVVDVGLWHYFWEGLKHLSTGELLNLFEKEDLRRLWNHIKIIKYLAMSLTPFYDLDELRSITESYISYLENQEEYIIKTGQPQAFFESGNWLDWKLSNLYFTKPPSLRIALIGSDGRYSRDKDFVFPINDQEKQLIEGLEIEDAIILKKAREKFFGLKISILRKLLDAINHQNCDKLWENCLQLLKEILSAEECNFFFHIDQFYYNTAIRKRDIFEMPNVPAHNPAGGLTDLLEVVGYYEKEFSIGTFSKTRNALGDIVETDRLKMSHLISNNYFKLIKYKEKRFLDNDLDLFLKLSKEEGIFWGSYYKKINKALDNEFYQSYNFEGKFRQKYIKRLRPYMESILEYINTYLEKTGDLYPIYSFKEEIKKAIEGYIFHKEEKFWEIIFKGEKISEIPDSKGMDYIAYLLKYSGQNIFVTQLEYAYDIYGGTNGNQNTLEDELEYIYKEECTDTQGNSQQFNYKIGRHASNRGNGYINKKIGITKRPYDDKDEEKDKEKYEKCKYTRENLNVDDIIDERVIKEYKERLAELKDDLKQAERSHDEEEKKRLESEIFVIEKVWKSATGLFNHSRRFPNVVENSRRAVANAITRSIKIIKKQHEPLAEHFARFIDTGKYCSYKPDKDIPWRF